MHKLEAMKLTLFGIWRHLLHEGNEVEEELCVVVGQFQIIAVLPEEHRNHLRWKKCSHATFTLCLTCALIVTHST